MKKIMKWTVMALIVGLLGMAVSTVSANTACAADSIPAVMPIATVTANTGTVVGGAVGVGVGIGLGAVIGGIGVVACGTGFVVPVGVVCLGLAAVCGGIGAITGGAIGG